MRSRTVFSILLIVLLAWSHSRAGENPVHHDLEVRLMPDRHRLEGADRLTLPQPVSLPLTIRMSGRARILRLEADGRPVPVRFQAGRLEIPGDGGRIHRLLIRYECVFDDPVQVFPVNTDNPGYGVTGIVSAQGAFLLPGAGWYPMVPEKHETFLLKVRAPAGTIAVTAGRSLGHVTEAGETVSTWQVSQPVEGLALSAAPYVVDRRAVGSLEAVVYLLPENIDLAPRYLEATASHIQRFERLFGPYPFEKFAVVENFFPTGYGFPSYTLLGSRVLRLPFIPRTSLAHEIAHCWWGNGVYVDSERGNWSEGLTAYVADYLNRETEAETEALSYRLQLLRNFAALVSDANDFPLSAFRSRTDPVSKTIGYDKSAMIFHMLRRLLGEDPFWNALRDVYQNRRFQKTSWRDLQQAFERRSGRDLDYFFTQWVDRKGAPDISLGDVSLTRREDRWLITGSILQRGPSYRMRVAAAVTTGAAVVNRHVELTDESTPFRIETDQTPRILRLDPAADVFRRLHPVEIPPTVNSIKGGDAVTVVLTQNLPPLFEETAALLIRSLGLKSYRRVAEDQFDPADTPDTDLLVIGYPQNSDLLPRFPAPVRIRPDGFQIDGTDYRQASEALFAVSRHPYANGRAAALFLPLSLEAAMRAAPKITHYGTYSYLVFRSGDNTDKGIWPVPDSPLTVKWE